MFLLIVPIFSCFSILPCILPGVPFSPFSMFNILVVTNSPDAISINSPVSISDIPCPKAPKVFVSGS